ncbi:GMC family oxidoreductase [Sphingomonas sp.]|uniref:GMC family oxidoreductase n=1 Tax=Sphingomonas sp. TaxID=28214 RepID=UPI002DBB557B|nr:GMC family oxidoreductase [Sphingomonas sp.]HEU4970229.1 GMC family oxidoreductase [Sphingomonas sp.]
MREPRAIDGRAPDVFRPGGWLRMRSYGDDEEVDFAIVGTGAGGGTLAAKLAEAGFSVVAFDAGPFWRPLEDFASDEAAQGDLYWTDERISGGADPIQLGSNNSGRGVGGSTVHYTMIALRWRPDWFRARSTLGYGRDWPISFKELEPYYEEAEEALKISGPVRYPWGKRRKRYPYRAHPVNASGLVLARGCERIGIGWSPLPLATLSAPRGMAHPCVYRGFCKYGCSTNAKQSVLVTFIPRAIAAGAEVRDLAMVGRIEMGKDGHASGLLYHRAGKWRRQKARHVVVAGYAIETPRLLLNSACPEFPDGLANDNGLVGTHLMTHSGPGVWGVLDEEIRSYKAPPCMAGTEHWNYCDDGKDFHGGYAFMSQGPLPTDWAQTLAARGLWGMALRQEMTRYNHSAGLVLVGETEPQAHNRVELADETDQYGLRIPRVTFSYSENDRRLIAHGRKSMKEVLDAGGAHQLWDTHDTSHLMGGCRMGDDPKDSVVDADGRSWSIPNLWVCDGSLFPTAGGVNPSLTIQALACRIGDRIAAMAKRGELNR